MSAPECAYFNDCSTPLCPLDEVSLSACSWFPDEETCHRRDLSADWIARARKIARAVATNPERGCFTFAMLSRNFRITAGLRGLDPDKEISADRVRQWLSDHPPLRELTADERQEVAARFRHDLPKRDTPTGAQNSEEHPEQGRETGTEPSDVKLLGEASV